MKKIFTDDKMLLLHTMLVLYIEYTNGCTNFDVYKYKTRCTPIHRIKDEWSVLGRKQLYFVYTFVKRMI